MSPRTSASEPIRTGALTVVVVLSVALPAAAAIPGDAAGHPALPGELGRGTSDVAGAGIADRLDPAAMRAETFAGTLPDRPGTGGTLIDRSCGDRDAHPPIRITEEVGPNGFVLAEDPGTGAPVPRPGSGVVAGTGTADDPYVIARWCIPNPQREEQGDRQPGILIEGTTSHVVVRDNVVVPKAGTENVRIEPHPWDVAIQIRDAAHVTLRDNVVPADGRTDVGIGAEDADGIVVESNVATGHAKVGIHLKGTADATVVDNAVHRSRWGIGLTQSSDEATIEGNNVTRNLVGIYAYYGTAGAVVRDNDATRNGVGAALIGSPGVTVRDNDVVGSFFDGIHVSSSEGSRVGSNDLARNEWGIAVVRSDGTTVADNAGDEDRYGIFVERTSDATIRDNAVRSRVVDLIVYRSTDARVAGNGLRTGMLLAGTTADHVVHDVADNTVRGAPLVYVEGVEDADVSGPAGQVVVANATGVRVHGVDVEGAVAGIHATFSRDVRVTGSAIDETTLAGVLVQDARDATVEDNTVRDGPGVGILVVDAPGATVADNAVRDLGIDGIRVWTSDGVVVEANRADDSAGRGVLLYRSDDALLRDNVADGNGRAGILLAGSSRAAVDHNTVSDNEIGIRILEIRDPARDNRLQANEIADNGIGVRVHGDTAGTVLRGSNVHGSADGTGLNATHVDASVDARRTWWGCPDGPDHAACDDVVGAATYTPWRTEANPEAGAR